MEERTRRIVRKENIQSGIVAALFGAAAVTMIVAAPNAAQLLKYLDPYIGKRNASRRMSQAVSRLVGRGMLERKGYGPTARLQLTAKGKQHAEFLFNNIVMAAKKPKRWDGRWRIVMFDVWERRRAVRDRLRYLLQKIGFVKLQNSVWTYPYDCEEVIALIRSELRVGKGAMYLIADGIEGDKVLREHFGLPHQ